MTEHQHCMVTKILMLLGKKHVLLILKTISEKHQSFTDIEKNIPDLNPRMLSLRLGELEQRGLVERTIAAEKPVKIRYILTAKGKGFAATLKKLCQRIQKNYPDKLCQHSS